jgi:hypothetical protein
MPEEKTENTEAIDKKDVTLDILIDDDPGDRPGEEGSAGAPPADRGDHPVVEMLNIALKSSNGYLQKQGLPPANSDIYDHFSKPFLNEALWHYFPDGGIPDDPRVALLVGVAGLGLAFAPTVYAAYAKKEEEEKRAKAAEEEKKRRRAEEEERAREEAAGRVFRNVITGEEIGRVGPTVPKRTEEKKAAAGAGDAAGPEWLARLADNSGEALPGM